MARASTHHESWSYSCCFTVSKPSRCPLVSCSSEQKILWTKVEQTGGHACQMDNIFADYALALSHTFILGFSHSLKAPIYWAPVARTVNYLCKPLMCVCPSSACMHVCVCVFHLHIRSGCFLWDKAVSSTISLVGQDNNDISVNPLLPSRLPASHPDWQ